MAMIPSTLSPVVPPDSSADQLLRLGRPFVAFPRFSILALQEETDNEGNPIPFSEWLTKRLQRGQPFVVADFDKLDNWPGTRAASAGPSPSASTSASASGPASASPAGAGFGVERLIELSTKKNIPIRNCSTGRDLSFTLKKFADSARQSFAEFQNLYARDLPCPPEWLEQCRQILPTEVQWGGRLDLFQWLPQCARSEVMMAYIGSAGSSSGFHRCFSSTVALNLLVETLDRPVVCIGTDFGSQEKYDAFMAARGVSPHLDWVNLGADQLLRADFPLYAYDQRVGDLVVFPPATAHQVWNPSTLSAKLVWNILHPLSLEVGFDYVQVPFNRLCHPDVARTNLSLACAMLSLLQDTPTANASASATAPASTPLATSSLPLPPDLPLLSRLFRQMVHNESIDGAPVGPVSLVPVQAGTIATCNFCSTAIWNRHVRCTQCADFDLCLLCYLNGRSCEHQQSYAWAELIPADQCTRVLNRAREILGFQPEEPRALDRRKTLGTAANDLMRAKASATSRLCHLCRIDHAQWKGRRCDKCTAFFCYRGLFRHFDQYPTDVLRHKGLWVCPKCDEVCNCRCCHFDTAYRKTEKPASKRRVKAFDPRGKVMGFADNVFDQRRGRKEPHDHGDGPAPPVPGLGHAASKKRRISSSVEPRTTTTWSKIELPTPERNLAEHVALTPSRDGSEMLPEPPRSRPGANLPALLPSIKTFADHRDGVARPTAETYSRTSSSPRLAALGPTTMGKPRMSSDVAAGERNGTLAPMLSHTPSREGPAGLTRPESSTMSRSSPASASFGSHTRSNSADDVPALAAALDSSILELEAQLRSLEKYEADFIALHLDDSRKMLTSQVAELERQLKERRREKSILLIQRLKSEGFGSLAAVVGREVGLGTG